MVKRAAQNEALARRTAGAKWWLYLLACRDGRTYAGIALDVDARFAAHLSGKGARFTRANPPLKVLGAQAFPTKSQALRAEYALKQLTPVQKLQWARRWRRAPSSAPIAPG
ncbi:MAG TPA: GIY-YIG nuclease family protein [Steroidobacter sp.]|nr:GIY-YIG nuclease family protein [Steroidobacter sp.]